MNLKEKDWLDKEFDESLKKGKLIVGLPLNSNLFYENFNLAAESNLMDDVLYSNDYNLLNSKLLEWKNNAKNENQIKVLDLLINASVRMFIHNFTLKERLKTSISLFQYNKSQNDWLKEKISLLHKQNIALKKENEYLTDEKYG